MRGITSAIAGMVMMGIATWLFLNWDPKSIALAPAAAAIFLMVQAYRGIEVQSLDDITTPMEFVSDPKGAITDLIVDRVAETVTSKEPEPAGPTMDHDAIIARYLENRPSGPPVAEAAPAPRPTFGRKGLSGAA